MAEVDPLLKFTLPFQLTKKIHRSVYPYISDENPSNSQQGKIIVITGGGTGIGAAAARVWMRAGAEGVVIAGRRAEVLEKTAAALRELGKGTVLPVPTDLTIASDVDNLFLQVKNKFGRPADVVVANAGWSPDLKPVAQGDPAYWWSAHEINMKGLHHTIASFINSQPDPSKPVGTVVNVNSGLAGLRVPGTSAYTSSKVAAHAYMEFIGIEYPSLRAFTLLPGVVSTDVTNPEFAMYAKDEAELTGSLVLYLAQSKADYLKGSLTSINWDVEEMEAHKDQIQSDSLLKMSWVPILPASGGSGF